MTKAKRTKAEIDKQYAAEYNKINEDVAACKIPSQELLPRLDKLYKVWEVEFNKLPENQKEGGFIRISLHTIDQTLGKTKGMDLIKFANIKNRDLAIRAEEVGITKTGWNDLTRAEERIIYTISILYSKNGYKNNSGNKSIFTPDEFYEAYGLKKHNYKGSMVYGRREKYLAISTLRKLAHRYSIAVYTRKNLKTGEYIEVEIDSTIIKELRFLRYELNESEPSQTGKNAKLQFIETELCEVFLDEIDNYYALLPKNLYPELREAGYSQDIYLPRFIIWIAKTISIQRRLRQPIFTQTIGLENLAYILQMDALIKTHRIKKVDSLLRGVLEHSKILGFLNDYKISQGKEGLKVKVFLNVEKFKTPSRIIDAEFEEDTKTITIIKRIIKWWKDSGKPFPWLSENKLIDMSRRATEKLGYELIERKMKADSFGEFFYKVKEEMQPKLIEPEPEHILPAIEIKEEFTIQPASIKEEALKQYRKHKRAH